MEFDLYLLLELVAPTIFTRCLSRGKYDHYQHQQQLHQRQQQQQQDDIAWNNGRDTFRLRRSPAARHDETTQSVVHQTDLDRVSCRRRRFVSVYILSALSTFVYSRAVDLHSLSIGMWTAYLKRFRPRSVFLFLDADYGRPME